MSPKRKKFLIVALVIVVFLWLISLDFSRNKELKYGVSFSKFHADELKMDWKQTYLGILDSLGARRLRLSAHWPLTEPRDGRYNFSEMDYQIREADKRNASYILAIGRRLPGWPECHEPGWAKDLAKEKKQEKILKLLETTVQRYKNSKGLTYWQVENEPFLTFFSRSACGALDKDFLDKEIELVRRLDPKHPVLLTDSGEFGTWFQAYKKSDVFGTSIYLYIWNHKLGPLRYPITPAFFRIKHSITRFLFGAKPSVVVELSSEPWLLQPIIDTPLETQFERMGIEKFNKMIEFSSKTGFDTFYLWGAEWWYWLYVNGHPEHWQRAQELFAS